MEKELTLRLVDDVIYNFHFTLCFTSSPVWNILRFNRL